MSFSSGESPLPWKFDNSVLRELPLDPLPANTPGSRLVPNACFSRVQPTPVRKPQMVAYSVEAMQLLFGDSLHQVSDADMTHDVTVRQLAGCELMPGSEPAAHCYCGFQFGNFAGQLGDGATMYLGDLLNDRGERWEIQLKGAGLTPYSRTADGRKVLRSSIREFLCSEAMHHLGVPTTRAGSCVTSDSRVERDIFYDGHSIMERCTIVSRIAPTFIRFGSFQIALGRDITTGRSGPSAGNTDILKQLLLYVVKHFYPTIWSRYSDNRSGIDAPSTSLAHMCQEFLLEVVQLTAKLVAHWQTVGFCHGVLNTDNMSILGLTIDYGPYGFMDRYDPDFICNGSDSSGRYSYAAQPEICLWNCEKLREALLPIAGEALSKEQLQQHYWKHYNAHYEELMRGKLGITRQESKANDNELFGQLFSTMYETGADFTLTFSTLTNLSQQSAFGDILASDYVNNEIVREVAQQLASIVCCSLTEYWQTLKPTYSDLERTMIMSMFGNNEERIRAAGGHMILKDLEKIEKRRQLKDMTEDQKHTADVDRWVTWLTAYIQCIKQDRDEFGVELGGVSGWLQRHVQLMQGNNPQVILRNYLAESVIRTAEEGDYEGVQELLQRLKKPYASQADSPDNDGSPILPTCQKPPAWALELRVT